MIGFRLFKRNFYKVSKRFNFDQFKERPKRHFVLMYKFIEDMHYKRIPYREDHINLVDQFEKNGNIVIGGSYFPNDGAMLLFQSNDETTVDNFVKKDPYYKNGLVKEYDIKEIELISRKRMDEIAINYKYR